MSSTPIHRDHSLPSQANIRTSAGRFSSRQSHTVAHEGPYAAIVNDRVNYATSSRDVSPNNHNKSSPLPTRFFLTACQQPGSSQCLGFYALKSSLVIRCTTCGRPSINDSTGLAVWHMIMPYEVENLSICAGIRKATLVVLVSVLVEHLDAFRPLDRRIPL